MSRLRSWPPESRYDGEFIEGAVQTADFAVSTLVTESLFLVNKATVVVASLPAAALARKRLYIFRQIGAGPVHIKSAAAGETIDGLTASTNGILTSQKGNEISLYCDGSVWRTVSRQIPLSYLIKTADYTVDSAGYEYGVELHVVMNKATAVALTLPAAANWIGRRIRVTQRGLGAVEVKAAAAGETIDGQTCNSAGRKMYSVGDSVCLYSDGSVWTTIENHCSIYPYGTLVTDDATFQTGLGTLLKAWGKMMVVAISGATDKVLLDAATCPGRAVRVESYIANASVVKSAGGTVKGAAAGTGITLAASIGAAMTFTSDGTNWV